MSVPFFSIIIPTRNEAEDILSTLESIRTNTDGDFEVLVVDASSDRTPDVVRAFGDLRFRLLPQDNRDGRCGARNQGIRAARGEVVVILNADVRLPSDFLRRLRAHYDEGADYVIVEARVENAQHPNGAMVAAEHNYLYRQGRETVNWCEGYSCRTRCAIEAGLFPDGFPVPICAGEDAVFGDNMARRFRRVDDPGLVVIHSVPEDFTAYWEQRVGRGRGCAQRQAFIEHVPSKDILRDAFWWTFKGAAWILLGFPLFRYAWQLHRAYPSMPARRLLWPLLISRVGHEVGRWKGYREISHLVKSGSPLPNQVQA